MNDTNNETTAKLIEKIEAAFKAEAKNIGRDWHRNVIEDYIKTGEIPTGDDYFSSMDRAAIQSYNNKLMMGLMFSPQMG